MVSTSTVAYVVGIGAILIAYFMAQEPRRARRRDFAVTEDMIDLVAVMLPQVDREVIRRDLERTHNLEVTTTRLLESNNRTRNDGSEAAGASAASSHPGESKSSLLGHYQLTGNEEIPVTGSGWKSSREERESQLKAQRQAMILKARKKMKEQS